MNDRIVLVGETQPRVYRKAEIYDPNIDGADVTASGKFVPAVDSLVIDTSESGKKILYTVLAVDTTTLATTLGNPRVLDDGTDQPDKVLSYGNDMYMLYYDDRVSETKLLVDSKVALFGSNSASYQLVRTTSSGGREIISQKKNTSNQTVSGRIEIVETPVTGVRKCAPCFTTHTLTNGEVITLEVYDSSSNPKEGVLSTTIKLISKRALIHNDLDDSANAITKFDVTCNQVASNGDWFLHEGQAVEELSIYPELTFSDKTIQRITIDNKVCYAYGLDAIETVQPGMRYPILFKYFVPDGLPVVPPSSEADWELVGKANGSYRQLTCTKYVTIKESKFDDISKLSPIPVFDSTNNGWNLRWMAYSQSRNSHKLVNVSYVTEGDYTKFDGTPSEYGKKQKIKVKYTRSNKPTYYQEHIIEVNNPTTSNTPFLYSGTAVGSRIYGDNILPHKRPVIYYSPNIDPSKDGVYYIPSSRFGSTQVAGEIPVDPTFYNELLDNFFWASEPPYLSSTETVSPTPTHYSILSASGTGILTTPVKISQHETRMTLNSLTPGQYVNSTVIVEFYQKVGNTYLVLFGVPVEVKLEPTE